MPLIEADWRPHPETDERLLDLHGYWIKLCRDGDIPALANFKPAAIARLLPSVAMIDVLEPRDFRIRLAGTELCQTTGQDLMGQRIGEIFPPDYHGEVLEHWTSVVERRQAKWARARMWVPEKDHLNWQGVVLPLRGEDGAVIRLAAAAVFHTAASKAA
jgi:hypothetical protein